MALTTDTVLTGAPVATETGRPRSHWIDDWRPEDPTFWETTGKRIARRNLWFSIFSEHLGFSVWTMWSVFVLFLGPEYGFDPGQKFLMTTLPAAAGSLLRLPYTFAVAKIGGRNWTIISSALLLLPCFMAAAVIEPGVSFGTMLAIATVAGVGGGNFSSSMANIDSFFPQRLKGWALGLNAGGGNLGVAVVQLVGLLVLETAGPDHPRILLGIYIPLVVVAALCAAVWMDNLTCATNEKRAMRDVMHDRHTYIMSFLYIGTFGSFIGYGFAFGQVLLVQFPEYYDTPVRAAYVTFLGPLLGSLIRPVGGWLSDKLSGSAVTFWNFLAMAIGAGIVLAASQTESLPLFIVGFVTLFVLSGIGNGSTYKMIPAIFAAKARAATAAGADPDAEAAKARRLSGALIGIAGAVGAFGGVLVNVALRQSFLSSGTGDGAYIGFIAFYVACLAVTWYVYRRPSRTGLEGV
ncbi:MAG TPA: nitrate/nitrite transporter [Acidimicrobiales bacterium]